MAKLTNMKLPKPSKKDMADQAVPSTISEEEYPYGLRLRFDDERIVAKLPILKKLDIGESVKIVAKATTTSIDLDKRQGKDGSKERLSVTIQIEDIAINKVNDGEEAFNEAAGKKE